MNRAGTIVALIITVVLFSGYTVGAKSSKSAPEVQGPPVVTYQGGDGRDCKHAVIVKGANDHAIEAEAEIKWLETRYPG